MREINRLLNDFELLDEYMNTSYGGTFSEDSIVKYLFLPYCLGLKIADRIGLSEFLEGKWYLLLKKFVFTNEELTKILKRCYELQKRIREQITEDQLLKEIDDYLEEKYNTYFLNKITDWHIEENKKKFLDIFSLLSGYSKISIED